MDQVMESVDAVTRREALRRVAWLLGGAVSAPTVAGVLAGCGRQAADAAASAGPALSPEQRELVAAIAERILPATDTPGARDAGVPEFIDRMLGEYYPARERERFLAGLAHVDERAVRMHGSPFLETTPEQQLAVLTELDREAFGPPPPRDSASGADGADAGADGADAGAERGAAGTAPARSEFDTPSGEWIWGEEKLARDDTAVPFMRKMKELTLVGYYTSEIGATQELRHEPVPGRYDGCVPFSEIGRAWAV